MVFVYIFIRSLTKHIRAPAKSEYGSYPRKVIQHCMITVNHSELFCACSFHVWLPALYLRSLRNYAATVSEKAISALYKESDGSHFRHSFLTVVLWLDSSGMLYCPFWYLRPSSIYILTYATSLNASRLRRSCLSPKPRIRHVYDPLDYFEVMLTTSTIWSTPTSSGEELSPLACTA